MDIDFEDLKQMLEMISIDQTLLNSLNLCVVCFTGLRSIFAGVLE